MKNKRLIWVAYLNDRPVVIGTKADVRKVTGLSDSTITFLATPSGIKRQNRERIRESERWEIRWYDEKDV